MEEVAIGFYIIVSVLTVLNTILQLIQNNKLEKYRSEAKLLEVKIDSYVTLNGNIRHMRNCAKKIIANFNKDSLRNFSTNFKGFEKVLNRNELYLLNDDIWFSPVHEFKDKIDDLKELLDDHASLNFTGEIKNDEIVSICKEIDILYKQCRDKLSIYTKRGY
jgi:hypothetical protein